MVPRSMSPWLFSFPGKKQLSLGFQNIIWLAVFVLRNTDTNSDADEERLSSQSSCNKARALTVIHSAPWRVPPGSTQYYLSHLTYNSKQIWSRKLVGCSLTARRGSCHFLLMAIRIDSQEPSPEGADGETMKLEIRTKSTVIWDHLLRGQKALQKCLLRAPLSYFKIQQK